jgi:predicted chitinase
MTEFNFTFNFTVEQLKQSLPDYQGNINELFDIFQEMLPKYRITSEERLAGFIDQFNHRTCGFTDLTSMQPANDVFRRQFSTYIKIPAENTNKYCESLKGAVDAAGWLWNINYLNIVVDNRDFKNLTKRINPTVEDIATRADNANRIFTILKGTQQ